MIWLIRLLEPSKARSQISEIERQVKRRKIMLYCVKHKNDAKE